MNPYLSLTLLYCFVELHVRSLDMVRYNFFSHTSKVSGKISMSDRLALVGMVNGDMAEKISYTVGLEYEGGKNV